MKSRKITLEPVILKVENQELGNEMYEYKLTEIDFITFGVPPDLEFLKEVEDTLAAFPISRRVGNHEEHYIAAYRLLFGYKFVWSLKANGHIRQFFQCGGMQSGLREVFNTQKGVYSSSHKLCILAVKILQEYSIYQQHWDAVRRHIKTQRQLLNSKYKFYTTEVEKRDGYFCRSCKTFEDLQLDHIKPVSRGGITELANVQFLCGDCNRAKSNH